MELKNAKILDGTLSLFKDRPMSIDEYYGKDLDSPVRDETIDFLVSNGYLKQNKYSFQITYKGRMRATGKSFCDEIYHRRIMVACGIIAAAASLITLILYISDKIFCG